MITMIQSGHKFAHVTTAELSWHVQICVPIRAIFFKQYNLRFGWWACEPFVEWVHGWLPQGVQTTAETPPIDLPHPGSLVGMLAKGSHTQSHLKQGEVLMAWCKIVVSLECYYSPASSHCDYSLPPGHGFGYVVVRRYPGKHWQTVYYISNHTSCWTHDAVNRMVWQLAETLVEIRGTLADIRGTTK